MSDNLQGTGYYFLSHVPNIVTFIYYNFLFCICLSEHPESSSSEELLFATTRDGEITSKLGYLVYILILFYELQF